MITLYTSPEGTGDGLTIGSPASLTSVKNTARTYSQSDNVTIVLRGGIYNLNTLGGPIEFTSADTPATGFHVVWINYPGEKPIISGGQQITGWTKHTTGVDGGSYNIWKATVPSGWKSRQFYVNNQRAERTRFDNGGAGVLGSWNAGLPHWQQFYLDDASFPELAYPADVELVQLGSFGMSTIPFWRNQIIGCIGGSKAGTITTFQVSPEINTIVETFWSFYLGTTPGGLSWIENIYELLNSNTKGQYFLPSTEDTIYYVPRDGEIVDDVFVAEAYLPHLEKLFFSNSGLKNTSFIGLSFCHQGWLKPTTQKSYFDNQAAHYADKDIAYKPWSDDTAGKATHPEAAIDFKGSENIRFVQIDLKFCGGEGLYLGLGCRDCSVICSEFTYLGSTGIRIGSFFVKDSDDGTSAHTNYYSAVRTHGNIVRSNFIHNTCIDYPGSVGIAVGFAEYTTVTQNEIYNMPYSGINNGWGWVALTPDGYEYLWEGFEEWGLLRIDYSNNNIISNNYIHDLLTYLEDGGAIYCLSSQFDSSVNNNYIRDLGWVNNPGGINPIYLDEGSRFCGVYNNVILKNLYSGEQRWLGINKTLSRGEIVVDGNFYQSGMTLSPYDLDRDNMEPPPPPSSITEGTNTAISRDSATWPQAALDIASNSGAALVITEPVINNTAVIYGFKEPGTPLSITGYPYQDYQEPTPRTWRALVTNVDDNLASLTVLNEFPSWIFSTSIAISVLSEEAKMGWELIHKSPSNGISILELPFNIEWYPSPDATAYQLQIASDAEFNNVVLDITTTETSYTVTELEFDITHYWRIRKAV
jgi:hypothetical protein